MTYLDSPIKRVRGVDAPLTHSHQRVDCEKYMENDYNTYILDTTIKQRPIPLKHSIEESILMCNGKTVKDSTDFVRLPREGCLKWSAHVDSTFLHRKG